MERLVNKNGGNAQIETDGETRKETGMERHEWRDADEETRMEGRDDGNTECERNAWSDEGDKRDHVNNKKII